MTLAIDLETSSTYVGTIAVHVTGAADGPLSITRTDYNGTNLVRLRDGQEPVSGDLVIVDAEFSFSTNDTIVYTVTDADGTTATSSVDGWTPPIGPIITAVQFPAFQITPWIDDWESPAPMVTGYGAQRDSNSTVHQIIDRSDPVVVLGSTRLRAGTMSLWFANYKSVRTALDALAGPYRYLLRQDVPGLDMYFTVNSAAVTTLDMVLDSWTGKPVRRWQVDVTYTEVLNDPTIPLLGAANWAWEDLAYTYDSWASVRDAYDTWADVAVGEAD